MRALDAMKEVADFARGYVPGSIIPENIQNAAQVVADYLGYQPAERWLWVWLNCRTLS